MPILELTDASCSLFERIWEVVKYKLRPAIHMEKQLGWACKLGGVDLLRTYKVGQTVVSQLMESQIWHQPIVSVGGGLSRGAMASAHYDARHFSLSLYTTGALQVATLVLELRGSESEWVRVCVSSLRGTARGSSSFFH